MTLALDGGRALVTGAGAGIGRATALRLAADGAGVACVDIDGDAAGEAAAEIRTAGGRAVACQADVRSEEAVARAVSRAREALGGLDAVVANAAVQLVGQDAPVDRLDLEVWNKTLDVNLTGVFLTCKHGIRALLAGGGGAVVCVTSGTGLYGLAPGFDAYSASKGGVAALVRVMAADYASGGIRVNGVVPGFTETPMTRHCMTEPDPERRRALQAAAVRFVASCADALAGAGLPCEIVAGGGTGTFDLTGASPVMTELHAGSYVVMDTSHAALSPGVFEPALHVLATVISTRGSEAVLDCGRKAVSPDMAMPAVAGGEITTRFIAEEHLGIRAPAAGMLHIGDRVQVIAGYAPTTVNLHGVIYVSSAGTVTDAWPVRARHGTADAMP